MAEGSRLFTFSYLSTLIGQDAEKQAEFFMLFQLMTNQLCNVAPGEIFECDNTLH